MRTTFYARRSWRAAVSDDIDRFAIACEDFIVSAIGTSGLRQLTAQRNLLVELEQNGATMRPHALLVAQYSPSTGQSLTLKAATGDPHAPARLALSPLGTEESVELPAVLAEAAITGFRNAPSELLPAGVVTILGGGTDVDSAERIFRQCGDLLRKVITHGDDTAATEKGVYGLLDSWSS